MASWPEVFAVEVVTVPVPAGVEVTYAFPLGSNIFPAMTCVEVVETKKIWLVVAIKRSVEVLVEVPMEIDPRNVPVPTERRLDDEV